MRVTITALSSQYIHMPLAPFCLKQAITESLPEAEVTLCDVNINDTQEDLLRRVMQTEMDVLCVCLYIWNRSVAGRLIRTVRAVRPEVFICVGGPEATFSVDETLSEMPVDVLIRGAGENALPQVLSCWQQHALDRLSEIEGVSFRRDGQVHRSGLAASPAPRADLYDQTWQTALNGRMAYVETSRGCPFSCAFCLSGRREKVQFMPQEEALALLIRIGKSGAKTVKLIDRTFNCDRARTKYLLRGLMKASADGEIPEVCYHFEVAADLFDDETLDLLAQAPEGLFQMEAGLQSFHPETLDACDRHTNMALLTDRIRRILAPQNVHLHIDLIAGLPQEDFEEFGRSFDQAFALHPHQLQLGFLKLIHGSRLRESDWGQRYAPDPPYEILSTPWMTYAELCRLHACAEAVERIHNSGRFVLTEDVLLSSSGLRPFELYLHLGEKMASRVGRWSLDALTQMLEQEGLTLGAPRDALHRAMLLDRLATDNTGYIPPFLQEDETLLRRQSRLWKDAHPEARRARFALLPGGVLACAMWEKTHPMTGRGDVLENCLSLAPSTKTPPENEKSAIQNRKNDVK